MTVRVLVTNDDGLDSPGLSALAAAAAGQGLDVVVAAPLTEASGMSAALTAVTDGGRIVLRRRDIDGIAFFGVGASPAYIVLLAGLGTFGPVPDLVLSGINRGANAGNAVLHSGTVGAALTAAGLGARAMAVSLDIITRGLTLPPDGELHWSTAAAVAASLLDTLADAPAGTVLNLNVPDRPADALAGLRQVRLAAFGQARMAVAESGDDFVRTTIELDELDDDALSAGTDLAGLAAGYATITAIRPPAEAADVRIPAQRADDRSANDANR
jgi:5'/3'-nucleotidase